MKKSVQINVRAQVAYLDKVGENKAFEFDDGIKLADFLEEIEANKKVVSLTFSGSVGTDKIGHGCYLGDDHALALHSHDPALKMWSRAGFKKMLRSLM